MVRGCTGPATSSGCIPTARSSTAGRGDHQLKIRGFRVEPAEIDAVLAAHPQVARAVTVLVRPVGREPRLVAHLTTVDPAVAPGSAGPTPMGGRSVALVHGPGQVRASRQLPLTANGKVDLARLATAP
jgi:pristinamycin I synthase-3/4